MAGKVDISDLELTTFSLEAWPGPGTNQMLNYFYFNGINLIGLYMILEGLV